MSFATLYPPRRPHGAQTIVGEVRRDRQGSRSPREAWLSSTAFSASLDSPSRGLEPGAEGRLPRRARFGFPPPAPPVPLSRANRRPTAPFEPLSQDPAVSELGSASLPPAPAIGLWSRHGPLFFSRLIRIAHSTCARPPRSLS